MLYWTAIVTGTLACPAALNTSGTCVPGDLRRDGDVAETRGLRELSRSTGSRTGLPISEHP